MLCKNTLYFVLNTYDKIIYFTLALTLKCCLQQIAIPSYFKNSLNKFKNVLQAYTIFNTVIHTNTYDRYTHKYFT